MKSFLLIGMGKFGHHLCRELAEEGNDLMIVDSNEEKLSDLLEYAASAKIGDCTKQEVLDSFSVDIFDACIVCIADDFQSSLEITNQLSEMDAKKIISLASTEIQAKFLLRNGADEVIFPERDIAQRIARSISNDSVFDCIELSPEYSIFEIAIPEAWKRRTIREVDVRANYNLNILAVKEGETVTIPNPEYRFHGEEHLMIIGKNIDVMKLI